MTKEERELKQVDRRVKLESATEVLYVVTRFTNARKDSEYPRAVESKVINITKRQLYEDMLNFDLEGWVLLGYIYTPNEKRMALKFVDEFKEKLRKSPAVKRVL